MPKKMRIWILSGSLFFVFCGLAGPAAAENELQVLTLQQAIETAVANNLQRKLAAEDLAIAKDKLAQAKSGYLPKLTLNAGYNRYNEVPTDVQLGNQLIEANNGLKEWAQKSAAVAPSLGLSSLVPILRGLDQELSFRDKLDESLDYYGFTLVLEQPLYTGNKLTAINKQAKANEGYAGANLKAADNNLVYEVKKSYYTVISAQQYVKTMEEAVNSMEKHLKEADAYYRAGMVPKLDVMRAEVKMADLRQKLLMARNGLVMSKMALNFVIGVELDRDYQVVDTIKYGPFNLDLQACQERALANRPEIVAINARVEMAKENAEIVKSAGKPVVAFRAENQHINPYNPGPSLQVGVVASMKIYDGGQVKSQVAEAEALLNQAEIVRELTNRAVRLEVEQAYRNLQAALETIEVAKRSLDQAQETVHMADVSYKAGLSTSLERIDAEVGLTQAKTNYTQALSLYNIALAQLEKAMGQSKEE